ncbi:MAG: hypothetical protein ACO222_01765 [Polynucleobacter sp.]
MADTKISALTASTTPLAGTEVLPIVQGGTTKQVSVANLTAGRAVSASSITLTNPLAVTSGGSGTTTAFTAGSVPFAGASGVYSQDNANFYWDDTNNRLGIGTATPVGPLDITNSGTQQYLSNGTATGTATGTVYSTLAMRSLKGGGANVFAYDDALIQTQRANISYNGDGFTHDSKLVFSVNSSNRDGTPVAQLSIDVLNTTLLTGNLVPGVAGKGINFTANTPAAGMTSQLLNWYEEGTFTPNIGGTATYTNQLGRYTRVGRLVTCFIRLTINQRNTGSDTTISGMPFTSVNSGQAQAGTVAYFANVAVNSTFVGVYIANNSTTLQFTNTTTATATATPAVALIGSGSDFMISITYEAA